MKVNKDNVLELLHFAHNSGANQLAHNCISFINSWFFDPHSLMQKMAKDIYPIYKDNLKCTIKGGIMIKREMIVSKSKNSPKERISMPKPLVLVTIISFHSIHSPIEGGVGKIVSQFCRTLFHK